MKNQLVSVLKKNILYLLLLLLSNNLLASSSGIKISGIVTDTNGKPVVGVNVFIKSIFKGAATNSKGYFEIKDIKPNTYVITASSMGFVSQNKTIQVNQNSDLKLNFSLKEERNNLGEVNVSAKSKATQLEQKGYSVKAIETEQLKTQSIQVNTLLRQSAGVGVRASGGFGSKADYYLSGMNGNSIATLIDYIPNNFYGSSYSIGMLPVSLVDRIDIYKGVVPVSIGTDALGGAINAITTTKNSDFLDLSYSIGSFNTHVASLSGQWVNDKSGLTARLSSFYNYSDNSYKVWGESVYYANESTGFQPVYFTEENPAIRFNDDILNYGGKFDLGFTNKKWADKFFVSVASAKLEKGVQTGETMASVYGAVRYNSDYIMSSMMYKKDDLFTEGLNMDLFIGYSETTTETVDTSSMLYNWLGEVTATGRSGGEIYTAYKSYYTQDRENTLARINTSYALTEALNLNLCYVGTRKEQVGADPYEPEYRQSYTEPQHFNTTFLGFAINSSTLNDRLRLSAFVKYYSLDGQGNDTEAILDINPVTIEITSVLNKWGGGVASSYNLDSRTILQFSLEHAIRLPTIDEYLGNGGTVFNNPYLEPEESSNINFDVILGRYEIGAHDGLTINFNAFYRDVSNLIQKVVQGTGGTVSQYENIAMVEKKGLALDLKFDHNHKLDVNANITYLDMRNNQQYDEENGTENIVYGDRLKNEPYLMANGGIRYKINDMFLKKSKLNLYINSSYVHEFYLQWPSLGSEETKFNIPAQLVFNAGLAYKFPTNKVSFAFDCMNFTNEQVYDNYLLQKPGRSFRLKINYHLK